MNQYAMMYRPAAFQTLPPGLKWEWVIAPRDSYWRADLPRDSRYPYGVIETDRELSAGELASFEMRKVS